MPYMDFVHRCYFVGSLSSSDSEALELAQFIINPESLDCCKNKITYVYSTDAPEETNGDKPIDINEIVASKINSGRKIVITYRKEDDQFKWSFIPVNILCKYKDKFKEELNKRFDFSLSNKIELNKENLNKIRNIYKSTCGRNRLNETSLLLYSGCGNKDVNCIDWYCCCCRQYVNYCECDNYPCRCVRHSSLHRCGCLYMGDIPLSNGNVLTIKRYYVNYYDMIGTIQVPHHGADSSNNDTFWSSLQGRVAVVSYGLQNKYRHPKT